LITISGFQAEDNTLSAGGLHLHPTLLPLYFPFLTFNKPHLFILLEHKNQGLLKTLLCHQY
jgi:hypothetical protein